MVQESRCLGSLLVQRPDNETKGVCAAEMFATWGESAAECGGTGAKGRKLSKLVRKVYAHCSSRIHLRSRIVFLMYTGWRFHYMLLFLYSGGKQRNQAEKIVDS